MLGGPGPRRQFCEPAVGPVIDELGQHVAQVGFGIGAVQLEGPRASPSFFGLRLRTVSSGKLAWRPRIYVTQVVTQKLSRSEIGILGWVLTI